MEAHYRSERAELFVLYGRRRAGKTELLRHFCADKAHVFFIATLSSDFKWSINPVEINVLDDLQRKAHLVDPEGRWPAVSYALFAKAGFTPALIGRAAAENVRLVEPKALLTDDR